MRTIVASWLLIAALGGAAPALADATADGRAVSEAFEKAVAAGNPQAVLALYRDDASVIWPGQGEEGKGKAVIEKLARGFLADMKGARLCPQVTDEHLVRRRLHRQPRPLGADVHVARGQADVGRDPDERGAGEDRRQVALPDRPRLDRTPTSEGGPETASRAQRAVASRTRAGVDRHPGDAAVVGAARGPSGVRICAGALADRM